MKRLVIVGGGLSGLATAFRVQQLLPQISIRVLEQHERIGGNIWTERRDGFQVELGPNGFLDNKPATLQLCRDLGLAERLIPASEAARKNRYLYLDGRLRLLPGSPFGLVTTDLLSWHGKLNFLAEMVRPARRGGGDESIAAFARRRAGREVAEVFADGLVTGIHGGDPALLSLPAAFPRLAELERQHGSLIRGMIRTARQRRQEALARGEPPPRPGRMWSFREGLRLLVETLRERLTQSVLTGVQVRRIEQQQGEPGWTVRGEGQECWPADAVVLACPAYQQAGIVADLDAELADRIGSIAYNRIAVVALGYRRADVPASLDGFGYIAPQRTRRDLLGVQWCSTIYTDRAPPGLVLLRALCGGWHRAEVAGWDDDRLTAAVCAELRPALGIEAAPVFRHLVRWDRAIPQYHLGHLDRVAWIEARAARYPGLFLTGNAYHGVAMNDCTEQAEKSARRVQSYLG